MTKAEYLTSLFDVFYSDIDNVFERFKVKWALLSVLRTNQTPVDVTLTNEETKKIILKIEYPSGKINEHYSQMETECRRIFISDLYSTTASFCIYTDNVLREKNINGRHMPAFLSDKYDQPLNLLNRFLKTEDKKFLTFLHNVRNSMVHYDGQHNVRNPLDYQILNLIFKTSDKNIGEQIIWGAEEMIEVYKKLRHEIFQRKKFVQNQLFK